MNKNIYYIPQSSPKQSFKVRGVEIKYVEGMTDYCKLYLRSKEVLAPIRIGDLEHRLGTEYFCRIHRSYIVQLDKVELITPKSVLIGSVELPIGDDYKYDFLNKIEILSKHNKKPKLSKGGIAILSETVASFLGELF